MADVGLRRYIQGLLRLSNMAIANALAHNGFSRRVDEALTAQPELNTVLAWGTASELVRDETMRAMATKLQWKYEWRVRSMVLEGMHHSGGDDINLHAALMLQGLKRTSQGLL